MRTITKLLIGILSCASLGSGIFAYNNQTAKDLKTSVEYTQEDTGNSETNNQEMAEQNQVPVSSQEETQSQGGSLENAPEASAKEEKIPAPSTPEAKTPETNTPEAKAPATSTPKAKAPATSTPKASTPKTSTPETSAPVTSTPTESTIPANQNETANIPNDNVNPEYDVTDNSTRTTITYDDINEILNRRSTKTMQPEQTAPTPAQAEAQAPTNGNISYNSGYANQVLSLLNEERAKAGLAPLTMNQNAVNAANVRAKEIVSSFSHTRPNGQSPFTALNEAGASYRAAGENIACGQKTPTEVMTGWMNSSGHRANILNSNFTQVGIACFEDPNSTYGYYWVQLFIG